MFPMREAGLAVASSIGGFAQVVVLAVGAKRVLPPMRGGALFTLRVETSVLLSLAAAGAMGVLVWLGLDPIRGLATDAGLAGRWVHLAALGVLVPAGAVFYALLSLKRAEFRWLRSRSLPDAG